VTSVLEVAARLVLGGVLAGASLAKLASPGSSRAALATFGIDGRGPQAFAFWLLIATELGLATGVIAGSETAAWLAAALMAMFAATMAAAIMRGRAGAPCACFGARSTVGWSGVGRNLILAAGFAALTFLPADELSTDEWLGLGLIAALIACAGLAIAVLALAREVGMLRLRLGPEGALEIAEEGPPLGSRTALVERFDLDPEANLALAVFVAESCHVCHALEPSIEVLAGDPLVGVETFEERLDAGVWDQLRVPGSPFAVALDRDGIVLAKGTFNNLAQLESVLAAAERRRAEREIAGAIGV
jgi:Methylamine utilisation protein MauE